MAKKIQSNVCSDTFILKSFGSATCLLYGCRTPKLRSDDQMRMFEVTLS
jgi:hypothetical protein